MKENKRSIITNIRIMLVALLIFIPLEFHAYSDDFAIWFYEIFPINAIYLKDFVKILSSGIFTGAFVTCLLNHTAYNVTKVSAIEEFCSANYRFNGCLYKDIELLEVGLPLDDVVQYYANKSDNLSAKFGDNEKKEQAEKRIKNYIWHNTDQNIQEQILELEDKEKYLDDIFTERITRYERKLEHIKKSYFKLADELTIIFKEIDNAFGNIDFMFGNNKYRKLLMYEGVIIKQRKILSKASEFKQLFSEDKYKSSKGIMVEYILNIQDLLFKEEKFTDLMNEDNVNLVDILEGDDFEEAFLEYVLVEEHRFNIDLILHRLLQYAYHNDKDLEKHAPVRHEYGRKFYSKKS